MNTINISLPEKLKTQAQGLISQGLYASFSDLVRDSIRTTLQKNQYDLWAEESKKDLKKGKAIVLKSTKDIDTYSKNL
ncbi:MAG: hypothetical protein HYS86_01985 [Candidatus Chisholmbacteria bacterium]|nr:hypothetical protein [Candidatus Chisholmbacteria bacterium]